MGQPVAPGAVNSSARSWTCPDPTCSYGCGGTSGGIRSRSPPVCAKPGGGWRSSRESPPRNPEKGAGEPHLLPRMLPHHFETREGCPSCGAPKPARWRVEQGMTGAGSPSESARAETSQPGEVV